MQVGMQGAVTLGPKEGTAHALGHVRASLNAEGHSHTYNSNAESQAWLCEYQRDTTEEKTDLASVGFTSNVGQRICCDHFTMDQMDMFASFWVEGNTTCGARGAIPHLRVVANSRSALIMN